MENQSLKETIKKLPEQPGIYKYYNQENTLIYVGKAKNLKKRVSSYFNKNQHDNKTRSLVSQINKLEFIVVNSEQDALLLENNLIKEHQPKYNILLRDDKTYPYIVITEDKYPKIYATRKLNEAKGEYYGPFPSVSSMYTVLNLIKLLFSIRNCDLNLNEKNINAGKFTKCLEYHLGNCKAPCEGLQSHKNYLEEINQAKIILKGDLSILKQIFVDEIKYHAANLEFEKAQKSKSKLESLEKFKSSSLIFDTDEKTNYLIVTFKILDKKGYCNVMEIKFGRIIQSKTTQIYNLNTNSDEEDSIFDTLLFDIIKNNNNKINELLTNIRSSKEILSCKITLPIKGEKKQLVNLSLKNIESYIENTTKEESRKNPKIEVLKIIQKELNLSQLPDHIECFDNSNFQGTTPVAAMVCYKNGIPAKKDWRHFNIKTVEGPNDFDSMTEIVYRRYKRLKEENQPYPKLVIIDGGKGQLSAAIKALKQLEIYGQIPIISIAKRLEEIFTPNDDIPLLLNKKSETIKLITQIRDDVHRFGITFHRKKRDTIKTKKGK